MALSDVQAERLIAAAHAEGPQAFAAVLWMLRTAARATETCHAHHNAISAQGTITVQRLKGSKSTTVELGAGVLEAVGALGDRGLIFPGRSTCTRCDGAHIHRRTLYHWIDVAGARARLPIGLRHPHALRHTAIHMRAAVLHAQGYPTPKVLADLRAFSGHRNLDMLMEYLLPAEHAVQTSAAVEQQFSEMIERALKI